MRAEVKSNQQANDALQQATRDKSALKEEVQELSQHLGSALDQIQKLTVDLPPQDLFWICRTEIGKLQTQEPAPQHQQLHNRGYLHMPRGRKPPAGQIPPWRVLGADRQHPAEMMIL